jgi:hypothetical protein
MHACGHDVHVACLAGRRSCSPTVAAALAGTVVALFQPAEETGDGARGMVEDGLADLIPAPGGAGPARDAAARRAGRHARPARRCPRRTACGSPCTGAARTARCRRPRRPGGAGRDDRGPAADRGLPGGRARGDGGADRGQHPGRHEEQRHPRPGGAAAQRPHLQRRDPHDGPGRHPPDRPRRVPGLGLPAGAGVRAVRPVPAHRQRRRRHRAGGRRRSRRSSGSGPQPVGQQSASEDFSDIPTALGVPYTYWFIGGIDAGHATTPRSGPAGSPRTSRSTTPPPSPRSSSRPWTPAPRRWSSPPWPGWPPDAGLPGQRRRPVSRPGAGGCPAGRAR